MRRYNKLKKNFTEIKEGEKFCSKCHGEGMVKPKRTYIGDLKKGALLVCEKCLGDGKLDWIECAVGKKFDPPGIDIKIEKKNIVIRSRSLKEPWTIIN